MQRILYNKCPACGSNNIHYQINATDHTVSKEAYQIWHCDDCTLRFTQDIPALNDIGRYYQSQDYISHSDTQKGLVNKLYHIVRNYTLGTKLSLIRKVTRKREGQILDIGAGTGAFLNTMQSAGWQVTGLEPDETARQVAKARYQAAMLTPDHLYTLANNKYDAITLWHVLEHVHDLQGYFQRFTALLKQDGRLIIAVPNYTSYDAAYYKSEWAAYDVPRHLYHFSPKSMEMLAAKHGFAVQCIKPMWFDSFYVSMLSEKYRNGAVLYVAAVLMGFMSNMVALFGKHRCSSQIYVLRKV